MRSHFLFYFERILCELWKERKQKAHWDSNNSSKYRNFQGSGSIERIEWKVIMTQDLGYGDGHKWVLKAKGGARHSHRNTIRTEAILRKTVTSWESWSQQLTNWWRNNIRTSPTQAVPHRVHWKLESVWLLTCLLKMEKQAIHEYERIYI